jgi:D-alanine-D-alanine ligase
MSRDGSSGVPGRRLRIAVLGGGRSSEREISLASARSVLAALDPDRYEAVAIGIGEDGRWHLPAAGAEPFALAAGGPARAGAAAGGAALVPGEGERALVTRSNGLPDGIGPIDVVFPVLHGPYGEDGTVQGLLETVGVPYVGAGVLASAIAMDKDVCKAVLRNVGIAVADSITLRDGEDDPDEPRLVERVGERLGWPVFVKPASLGSSVGISKVHGPDELPRALELAFRHDPKALVEEHVAGREVECGVLGNERPAASAVGEILPHAEWYDYGAKYDEGGSDIVIPAEIGEVEAERVREVALRAYRACACEGMARVDFFLLADGSVVLNEINTIPGFTATSVYARLFEAVGLPYGQLCDQLIELARERFARNARYRH